MIFECLTPVSLFHFISALWKCKVLIAMVGEIFCLFHVISFLAILSTYLLCIVLIIAMAGEIFCFSFFRSYLYHYSYDRCGRWDSWLFSPNFLYSFLKILSTYLLGIVAMAGEIFSFFFLWSYLYHNRYDRCGRWDSLLFSPNFLYSSLKI